MAQRKTAGNAASAAATLFEPNAAHWAKIKGVAATPRCRSALAMLVTKKTDPIGVACLNEAMAAASEPLNNALTGADAFDKALERQLPASGNRLSQQMDTLRAVALGQQPADQQLQALWAATLRYATLFQTAEEAVSPENRKKITDAFSKLAEALK